MKMLFASIVLFAACGGDPLDPGAGHNAGDGTRTLYVEGRAHAEPRFANAKAATDYTTEIAVRISLNDQPVTTGTVTVSSRFGDTPLAWRSTDGTLGEWFGTMANYDEVYQFDIVSGQHDVTGVIIDGPDIHYFTAPAPGATLDSTVPNPINWERDARADITTFDPEEVDRFTIDDTGTYMMSVGLLKADRDQARENRLELRRTNNVVPGGAIPGSSLAVTVENYLTVVVQPNPAL